MKKVLMRAGFFSFIICLALTPLAVSAPAVCPAMPMMSMEGGAYSSCCGSGHCGCEMKSRSGQMEWAMLPSSQQPSTPQMLVSLSSSVLPVWTPADTSVKDYVPSKASDKDKLYDAQSNLRL